MSEPKQHTNKGQEPHNKGKGIYIHRKMLRLDDDTQSKLKTLEQDYKLNSSEVIRKLINDMHVIVHASKPLTTEEKELMKLLGRVQNNVNQLAKAGNELRFYGNHDSEFFTKVNKWWADLAKIGGEIASKLSNVNLDKDEF
jgi:hypothetical protein